MIVSVLREHAAAGGLSDRSGALLVEHLDMAGNFGSVCSNQDLRAGFQEFFDAVPGIGNDAGGRARGFEDACRR